jgi:hypothetical protein
MIFNIKGKYQVQISYRNIFGNDKNGKYTWCRFSFDFFWSRDYGRFQKNVIFLYIPFFELVVKW